MAKINKRRLNYKNSFIVSLFINILLLLALLLLLVFVLRDGRQPAQPALPSADGQEQRLNIDQEALLDLAFSYGVSTDYLQQVLPGYLIYYYGGDYRYDPIDERLGLHQYDWSHLVYQPNGRLSYQHEDWPQVQAGVDVSYYQGQVDWAAVAADGIDFAMVRLGYRGYESGALATDETAVANLDGAAAAGLDVGAYFFSQAVNVDEAEQEAQLALDILAGRELAYPLVFDMEEIWNQTSRVDGLDQQQATDIALAFCRVVEQAGYQSMIYGNIAWLAARLDLSRLTDSKLWLAQYSNRPGFPYHMDMWQYTSSGQVNGVNGDVDLNIYFGE